MLYRATVVENVDPENRGRIKFRAKHTLNAPIDKLPYAEYCSPFGGGDNIDGAGIFFIPEIGSQIWIIDEEDDQSSPVWIGSSFYSERGRQNIPIEAQGSSVEPLVRAIKTPAGNKILFDDRPVNQIGDPVTDIELSNRNSTGLTISEPTGNGRGIRLGFGLVGGELKLTREGFRLKSNKNAGLTVNDTHNMVRLADSSNSAWLNLLQGKFIAQANSGIKIDTSSSTVITSNKGFSVKSSGGLFEVKSANQRFISAGDTIIQNGGRFNVNANQFNFTGQATSNFTVELAVPGVPGTNQGNITLETASGGILLRNGLASPVPGPTISPTTFTNNDPLFPTIAGRLAIGDITTGNALLEGRLGGIFISGKPQELPGTAGGLGGRAPVALAPITPSNVPGTPQSAVLGGNLYQLLTQLTTALNTLLTSMVTAAPSWSTSPMGPTILNPSVVSALTTFQTTLTTLQQTYYSPTPGVPTNVLSSTVFVDG